ncbi:hypothetical protein L3X38_042356 [Prunus dulcis]|uniref:Uncharacterized protein n=1 Tax=Prunus dulcis TaxID=3755 RepID=A0AAD4UWF3_PRUDU|nr:hypothetical protein L3X38_042356 [Prunus dulcis]
MSSPNTRAKSSSSLIPPDYITGTGIDKYAIEVHIGSVLSLLKWQTCSKMTLKLPCVHSQNLSRSFPSSEVRNSPVKWADWIDRLLPRYGAHWRRAGIYDAILLSKQSINRDENLLAAALCF